VRHDEAAVGPGEEGAQRAPDPPPSTAFEPPHDAFWGDRTAQFLDPSGHRWAIDRHLRDVPTDELAAHVAAMFA